VREQEGQCHPHIRAADGDDSTVAHHLERSEDTQHRLHPTIFVPRAGNPLQAGYQRVVRGSRQDCKPLVPLSLSEHVPSTREEAAMPLVEVKLVKGVFSREQKQEMIHKITETMVGIEGEALRPVTWVLVEELESGDWGIGGSGKTTQDIKDLQATST
jgi:4-oxalocrotonate tautomerase